MADLHEPDVGTAYYRSTDPIKNLKIRLVVLKQVYVLCLPKIIDCDK